MVEFDGLDALGYGATIEVGGANCRNRGGSHPAAAPCWMRREGKIASLTGLIDKDEFKASFTESRVERAVLDKFTADATWRDEQHPQGATSLEKPFLQAG